MTDLEVARFASYPLSALVSETQKDFLDSLKSPLSTDELRFVTTEVILKENDDLDFTVDSLTKEGVADERLLLFAMALSLPKISRVLIGKLAHPFISSENLPGVLIEVFSGGDSGMLRFVKEYFSVIPPTLCIDGEKGHEVGPAGPTSWDTSYWNGERGWKKFFFSLSSLGSTDAVEEFFPFLLPTADLVVAVSTLEKQYLSNPARVDGKLLTRITEALGEGAEFHLGMDRGCPPFQKLCRFAFPKLLGQEGKERRTSDIIPVLKEFIKRDGDIVNSVVPGYPQEVLELFLRSGMSEERIDEYLKNEVDDFSQTLENDNIVERVSDDQLSAYLMDRLKTIETLVRAGGKKEYLTPTLLKLSPSLA